MILDSRELRRAMRSSAWHLVSDACQGLKPDDDAVRYAAHELASLMLRRGGTFVDADSLLSRSLTLAALATREISAMSSSVAVGKLTSLIGRSILVLAVEMVRAAACHDERVHVFVVVELREGDLVLAVATPNGRSSPVLSMMASSAFARATRIARALSGQLVRGVDDGRMVFGFTMSLAGSDHRHGRGRTRNVRPSRDGEQRS